MTELLRHAATGIAVSFGTNGEAGIISIHYDVNAHTPQEVADAMREIANGLVKGDPES